MTLAIKNYTTKVDVYQSLGEIQGALAKHGATKIMIDYENEKTCCDIICIGRAVWIERFCFTRSSRWNASGIPKVKSQSRSKSGGDDRMA